MALGRRRRTNAPGPSWAPRPQGPSLYKWPRYPGAMLYWATKPDPLFRKIVDVALSVGRDLVRTWEGSSSTEWANLFPELANFFTPATSNRELERLRVAHGSIRSSDLATTNGSSSMKSSGISARPTTTSR